MKVEGFVKAMSEKSVTTRRGPATTYSILLDDDKWYSMGFKKPSCTKGDFIAMDAEDSSFGWQGKNLVVGGTPTVGSGSSPSASKPASGVYRKTFPLDPTDPEMSQIRRSAGHLAASLYKPYLEHRDDQSLTVEDLNNMKTIATFWEGYFSGQNVVFNERSIPIPRGMMEADKTPAPEDE
jgi:hypothetical protein